MDSVVREPMQSESEAHVSSENEIYRANQGSCVAAARDCHIQSWRSSPNSVIIPVQSKLARQFSEYKEPEGNLKALTPRDEH